jgi:hypothetical protein
MRLARILGIAGFVSMALGSASAGPLDPAPAAKLSAVLGGALDSELGNAGELAHPIDCASIELHAGRSAEYRRRVALESAANTLSAAHRPTLKPRTETPRAAL